MRTVESDFECILDARPATDDARRRALAIFALSDASACHEEFSPSEELWPLLFGVVSFEASSITCNVDLIEALFGSMVRNGD